MNTSVARGSCLCGSVRFSVSLPTKWVAHCHCSYCRRAHGAPFVTWAGYATEQFSIDPDASPPSWYESSPGARRGFCPHCGSPMFFESARWPGETHVARALLQGPLDKEPSVHVFYETHVSWLDVNDDLPKKVSQNPSPQEPAAPPP
ncbi:MAG: GFA family protein [Rhodoferax sp.]|nr:GFA family protein [Rhodoferax sp.]